MNINFLKSLRQNDLKILNQKEIKQQPPQKISARRKENELSLENQSLSNHKFKIKNCSFDKIFASVKIENENNSNPNFRSLIKRNKTNDYKDPFSSKIVIENTQVNPMQTRNNFFLTSNRSNIQSRKGRSNFQPMQNFENDQEFIFFKKVTLILLKALNS